MQRFRDIACQSSNIFLANLGDLGPHFGDWKWKPCTWRNLDPPPNTWYCPCVRCVPKISSIVQTIDVKKSYVKNVLRFLLARRYASVGNSDCNVSVCPSVRLSVTRRYCVKTKKASVTISSASGCPKIVVFWRQISLQNSKGFPPNGSLKEG